MYQEDDRKEHLLSLTPTREGFVLLAIQVLSLMDLFLTLTWWLHGGAELNPMMAMALERGPGFFAAAKVALTTLSLILFGLHLHLRPVRYILFLILFLYLATLGIHLCIKTHLLADLHNALLFPI
jgi:hypothetical protein